MHRYPLFCLLSVLAVGRAAALDTLRFSDSRFSFAFVHPDTAFRSPIKEVIVTVKASGDTLQHLQLPENEGYIPAYKSPDYIPDVNFDGYSDIHIFVTTGAGPNSVDLYYVFNPKSKAFVRDSLLEAIPSATFDPRTKTIHSSWTSGCCYHGENTYRYGRGKPVLILEKACQPDSGIEGRPYLSTVKRRRRGKMVLIKKRYLSEKYVTTVGFGW